MRCKGLWSLPLLNSHSLVESSANRKTFKSTWLGFKVNSLNCGTDISFMDLRDNQELHATLKDRHNEHSACKILTLKIIMTENWR